MTRILTLTALMLSLTAPAQAFVVGSPSFPDGWPVTDPFKPADTVTRDTVTD